jgi:hypothetical protein
MKLINKYFILVLCCLTLGTSSCLEDKEEMYDILGAVATIPVFTSTNNRPTAGSTVTLSVRYYSPNAAVKELQLYEKIATADRTQVTTKAVTGFNTENSYVDTFNYTVPANATGRSIVLEVVAVTVNDLTNSRTLTLTIP